MRGRSLVLLLVFAGCRLGGVSTLPITGEVPAVIAVWPIATGAQLPEDEMWFAGLASALSRRGYQAIPPGITAELLRTTDLASPGSDDGEIGRALRADALLHLEVRGFDARGTSFLLSAEWDLKWRLLSTRGHGEQWSFTHQGSWQQIDRDPFDPTRSLDEDHQPRDIVPIGGLGPPNFRNPQALLAHLHNLAMQHLPKL